ncbi:hypothetical protein MUN74_00675 [Agromyces endophyticus]|uniref:hypothetical protein n=1 Tax=Agromyces sp. H17E-10 TaxID=2932244 RepID=UPI001FD2F531|nr:hypothetical protein [Agromyces sp. H17E-10]UOQ89475.1 hypothetical protein MUN74_00675 [Agromyces sp. H17E-10]
MSRMLLTLSATTADSSLQSGDWDEVFLWTTSDRSSFVGAVDPYLASLGPVNPFNVDLVRIALAVLASDRSVLRAFGGSDWNSRDFEMTVEVGDPTTWTAHASELSALVGFLTGDQWAFSFTQAPAGNPSLDTGQQRRDRTILLSGGADSAVGAIMSALELGANGSLSTVSHFSSNAISPTQRALVTSITDIVSGIDVVHHRFHVHRKAKRLDGTRFRDESSTRSRSLLFLALGLAVAEQARSPLWIAENGFASLNPPLGPDRRGSLSTHTTHPRFLRDLSALMGNVGGHGTIHNPFERLTKGEMYGLVREALGVNVASLYLSSTNSCSHTDARFEGAPGGSSCGVCFGCLVRRSAFVASGVPDVTVYLAEDPTGRYAGFVAQKSIIEPVRDFVDRGVRASDVMTMSLPADYPAREALDLCARGIEELRGLVG